jgi:hypothetical protein
LAEFADDQSISTILSKKIPKKKMKHWQRSVKEIIQTKNSPKYQASIEPNSKTSKKEKKSKHK